MSAVYQISLTPKKVILTGVSITALCAVVLFIGISLQHQLNLLTRENERLQNNRELLSADKLKTLSKTLSKVAFAAKNLDRMHFHYGKTLSLNVRAALNQPEAEDRNLKTEEGLNGSHCSCCSEALKRQAEDLLTLMNKVEDSVRRRNDTLRYIPSIMPVNGLVSSPFGYRNHPLKRSVRKFHRGIDISAKPGTPVLAAADGIVKFSGWNRGYGRTILVSHGSGLETRYAHHSKNLVRKGDKVKRGTKIAEVGSSGSSSGPHLHYEVLLNKTHLDPGLFLIYPDPGPSEASSSRESSLASQDSPIKHDEEIFSRTVML